MRLVYFYSRRYDRFGVNQLLDGNMHVGSDDIVAKWCEGREFVSFQGGTIRNDAIKQYSVDVHVSYKRLIVFLNCLLSHEDSTHFAGALLYVHEWIMSDEDATLHIFNRLRESFSNDKRQLEDARATVFESGERDELFSLLLLTLLGGWDATCVPSHGRYVFDISNDGFVDIAFREEHVDDDILASLTECDYRVLKK
jgi:hypothetical protein